MITILSQYNYMSGIDDKELEGRKQVLINETFARVGWEVDISRWIYNFFKKIVLIQKSVRRWQARSLTEKLKLKKRFGETEQNARNLLSSENQHQYIEICMAFHSTTPMTRIRHSCSDMREIISKTLNRINNLILTRKYWSVFVSHCRIRELILLRKRARKRNQNSIYELLDDKTTRNTIGRFYQKWRFSPKRVIYSSENRMVKLLIGKNELVLKGRFYRYLYRSLDANKIVKRRGACNSTAAVALLELKNLKIFLSKLFRRWMSVFILNRKKKKLKNKNNRRRSAASRKTGDNFQQKNELILMKRYFSVLKSPTATVNPYRYKVSVLLESKNLLLLVKKFYSVWTGGRSIRNAPAADILMRNSKEKLLRRYFMLLLPRGNSRKRNASTMLMLQGKNQTLLLRFYFQRLLGLVRKEQTPVTILSTRNSLLVIRRYYVKFRRNYTQRGQMECFSNRASELLKKSDKTVCSRYWKKFTSRRKREQAMVQLQTDNSRKTKAPYYRRLALHAVLRKSKASRQRVAAERAEAFGLKNSRHMLKVFYHKFIRIRKRVYLAAFMETRTTKLTLTVWYRKLFLAAVSRRRQLPRLAIIQRTEFLIKKSDRLVISRSWIKLFSLRKRRMLSKYLLVKNSSLLLATYYRCLYSTVKNFTQTRLRKSAVHERVSYLANKSARFALSRSWRLLKQFVVRLRHAGVLRSKSCYGVTQRYYSLLWKLWLTAQTRDFKDEVASKLAIQSSKITLRRYYTTLATKMMKPLGKAELRIRRRVSQMELNQQKRLLRKYLKSLGQIISSKKAAATKIQAISRGNISRKKQVPVRQQTTSRQAPKGGRHSRRHEAATRIQAVQRGYIARRCRQENENQTNILAMAATRIQALFRRYQSCKKMAKIRISNPTTPQEVVVVSRMAFCCELVGRYRISQTQVFNSHPIWIHVSANYRILAANRHWIIRSTKTKRSLLRSKLPVVGTVPSTCSAWLLSPSFTQKANLKVLTPLGKSAMDLQSVGRGMWTRCLLHFKRLEKWRIQQLMSIIKRNAAVIIKRYSTVWQSYSSDKKEERRIKRRLGRRQHTNRLRMRNEKIHLTNAYSHFSKTTLAAAYIRKRNELLYRMIRRNNRRLSCFYYSKFLSIVGKRRAEAYLLKSERTLRFRTYIKFHNWARRKASNNRKCCTLSAQNAAIALRESLRKLHFWSDLSQMNGKEREVRESSLQQEATQSDELKKLSKELRDTYEHKLKVLRLATAGKFAEVHRRQLLRRTWRRLQNFTSMVAKMKKRKAQDAERRRVSRQSPEYTPQNKMVMNFHRIRTIIESEEEKERITIISTIPLDLIDPSPWEPEVDHFSTFSVTTSILPSRPHSADIWGRATTPGDEMLFSQTTKPVFKQKRYRQPTLRTINRSKLKVSLGGRKGWMTTM